MFHLTKTLNTFYLLLYCVGHMVKDHSDSERGNPLPPLHGLLVLIRNISNRSTMELQLSPCGQLKHILQSTTSE